MSPSAADIIRGQINIVDVVGQYVRLKRRGSRHVGLCPFHSEKTASFGIPVNGDFFKCFGCDAAGDVFTFVQRIEDLSFSETLKFLARQYGIDVSREELQWPKQKRLTSEDLANAELFRTGFGWALERYLVLSKELWAFDETALERPEQIREITGLLQCIQDWPARTLVAFMRRYRRVAPWFMADCIREAKETQLQLAAAISPPVDGGAVAA